MNAENPLQTTATGLLLVQRLNRLVGGLLANRIPGLVGKRISKALDEADSRLARRTALERATAILDAGEGLSRWALAQALESALVRFGKVGYWRVKSGHRTANELETCLIVLLETRGPKCAKKLWEEMGGFGIPHFPESRE